MAIIANTGFDFGTTTLITYGNAGYKLFDAVSGSPTIPSGSAHTGTYCLECSLAAATYYRWTTSTLGASQTALVGSLWVNLSSDPSAAAVFTGIGTASSATAFEFQYDPSTDAVIAECNITSTNQASTTTFPSGEWHNIEFCLDVSANPWTLDWKIDGDSQPQFQPAAAASTIATISFGSTGVYDGTCRYDDIAVSTTVGDYPLGFTKSILLRPDAAGTYTISGTTANFNVFTANGTLASWNAANARDYTRELPPVVSASSNGWCQVTTAASDYVQMPFETYTLQAGESVLGAQMEVWGWATTTTAATIRFDSYNGTTARTLFAVADPNFGNGTTSTSGMVCAQLTLADIDTQAELDALCIRGGYSSDAAPDIGVNTVYVEVCVRTPYPPKAVTGALAGAGAMAADAVAFDRFVPVTAALSGTGSVTADASAVNPPSYPVATSFAQTAWSRITASYRDCTSSITWSDGDLIVALGGMESGGTAMNPPTCTGLTFTAWGTNPAAGQAPVYAYSATAAGDGSGTVRCNLNTSGTSSFGLCVWVFHSHGGRGNRAQVLDDDTDPYTVLLARSGDHSNVVTLQADYAAVSGLGSFTPALGADGNSRLASWINGAATYYAADWGDEGTSGSTSYGTTGESGGTPSITAIALEILAEGATVSATAALAGAGGAAADQVTTVTVAAALAGASSAGATASVVVSATATLAGAGSAVAAASVLSAGVTFDATYPGQYGQTFNGSTSWSHTISGTNNAIVVGVGSDYDAFSATPTVTFTPNGGTAQNVPLLGKVTNNNTNGGTYLFGLAGNFAPGAGTVALSNWDADVGNAGSMSFNDVDQTAPFGTAQTNNGSGTTATVDVSTTSSQSKVAGVAGCGGGAGSQTGGTQCWAGPQTPDQGGPGRNSQGGYYSGTGGTVTVTEALGVSDWWGCVGVEIKPTVGTVSVTAALAGAGGAAVVATSRASVALVGTGSAGAVGGKGVLAATTGAGSAASRVALRASAAIGGVGSAASGVTVTVAAVLTGGGAATAVAGNQVLPSADLTGAGSAASGVTVTVAAVLTGTGAAAAAAASIATCQAALTGAGSLNSGSGITTPAAAGLAGSGSAASGVIVKVRGALVGAGSISGITGNKVPVFASLAGAASVTSGSTEYTTGTITGAGDAHSDAAVAVTATLAAAGDAHADTGNFAPVAAAAAAVGSVSSDVAVAVTAPAAAAGDAHADVVISVTAALAGAGDAHGDTGNFAVVTAALAGAGDAHSDVLLGTSADLIGAGDAHADAASVIYVTAALAGTGSAATVVAFGLTATLPGAGSITAGNSVLSGTSALLPGAGSVDGDVVITVTAALSGAGGLTATGLAISYVTARLAGAGDAHGTGVAFYFTAATARLAGAGSAKAVPVPMGEADLAGVGSLAASPRLLVTAALVGTCQVTGGARAFWPNIPGTGAATVTDPMDSYATVSDEREGLAAVTHGGFYALRRGAVLAGAGATQASEG